MSGSSPVPELVELLARAQRIFVFTGAGISTGSGIPDYRGPQGVWKTRQPVYYNDFLSSEEARVEYWNQKLEGWTQFRDARPNETHRSIARLEEAGKIQAVVTQNIDGLHVAAGSSRQRVVELHGTNSEIECQSCGERSEPGPHFEAFDETRKPPVCSCGGLLKPATISFGQNLREEDLTKAAVAASSCDLVLSLGSTLSVTPAADFPLLGAEDGSPYVVINRGETAHDDYEKLTLRLEGDVGKILPPAVESALGRR